MEYHEALETLYHQYKVLVYNLALHYVQNIEDAEEITQDVFLEVYQNLDRFKNNSNIKTWIYRISINKSLDFLRKKNSKKRFFMFGNKSSNEQEYYNYSTFEHPGVVLENQEKAKILFDSINSLPQNQKTAFILSKIEQLPNLDVASIMQTSVSSVESLLFRAKKALQKKLEHIFEEYRRK